MPAQHRLSMLATATTAMKGCADAALRAAQSLGCSHLRNVLVSAHVLTRRQRRLKQTQLICQRPSARVCKRSKAMSRAFASVRIGRFQIAAAEPWNTAFGRARRAGSIYITNFCVSITLESPLNIDCRWKGYPAAAGNHILLIKDQQQRKQVRAHSELLPGWGGAHR